ncbi:MAG: FmdB family zinc ribbon protein [Thermodesulfobacteriota bacterium]
MPIYQYECADCGFQDQRLAGVNDHMAICTKCKGVMVRRDLDMFESYFLSLEEGTGAAAGQMN